MLNNSNATRVVVGESRVWSDTHFLFVSPLLNPIIVGLMWVTFGWKVTLLYAIIAAGVSVLASIVLDLLGFERHIVDHKNSASSGCTTKCDDSEASVKRRRVPVVAALARLNCL